MADAEDSAEDPRREVEECAATSVASILTFDATDLASILDARRHPMIDQCKAHAEKRFAAAIRVGKDTETATREASETAAAYLEGFDQAHAQFVAALDAAEADGVSAEEVASVISRSRKASFDGLCRAVARAAHNRH